MLNQVHIIKKRIAHNVLNIPGWHTNRKIVVIESDDWGSIRMPSKEAYNSLLKAGIKVNNCPFCQYDSLANSTDLSYLFEVLASYHDQWGNHPIITANTIVANPVFEKIAASDYTTYYYEPFTETLKRPPYDAQAFQLWQEGIKSNVFHPQFHGREHLNITKWLQALRSGEKATRIGFDHQTYGLTHATTTGINGNYMGAFDSCMDEDIRQYQQYIKEGMLLFEELFGFRSKSFIATTYTWSNKLEPALKKEGILYLQGLLTQRIPLNSGDKFTHTYKNYTGSRNNIGQYHLMRNAFFEPSLDKHASIVDECMRRIKTAFRWKKPAIISSHRLNYIGSIDGSNRDRNLHLLNSLLHRITNEWPEVEFMTSDSLGDLIDSEAKAVLSGIFKLNK